MTTDNIASTERTGVSKSSKENNNVTKDSNGNRRLRTTPSPPSSPSASSSLSSSAPASSSTQSSPPPSPSSTNVRKRRSITVKTNFHLRASHIFFATCFLVVAMIPFYVFDSPDEFLTFVNAFFFPPVLKSSSDTTTKNSFQKSKHQNSNSKAKKSIPQPGGWRQAEPEILAKYNPGICNIEKISVTDLTRDRFESEIRYKKPVIVTFPDGAAGWTDPAKWTRAGLVQEYSRWKVSSGSSLEIVRKGGNGDQVSSLTEFVNTLQNQNVSSSSTGSKSYMFDRSFYFESSLPETLKLPEYFSVSEDENDSIFFLGASLSGVVFHKHSDTWNGVVYGRKRWFLYPSTHTPPGGVYNGFSILNWLSGVYPKLSKSDKPVECVQEAGEIFYLPEGWYHATLNLGDTVAFAIQKKDPFLDTEILFYEVTDLMNNIEGDALTSKNRAIHTRLLEVYTELYALLPESSEVMMKKGEALYNLEQYSASLEWYSSAISKDPFFVFAYIHKGKCYNKLKEYQKADDMLKKAMVMSPNLWDVYKEYGSFLMEHGRLADALPVFKKDIKDNEVPIIDSSTLETKYRTLHHLFLHLGVRNGRADRQGTEIMPGMIPFWYFYQQCQTAVGDIDGAQDTEKVIAGLKAQMAQRHD